VGVAPGAGVGTPGTIVTLSSMGGVASGSGVAALATSVVLGDALALGAGVGVLDDTCPAEPAGLNWR
jgi:hypothetical protein